MSDIKANETNYLEMLEDDDEFQEFETQDWEFDENIAEEEEWEVDWDDVLDQDDFVQELRQELS
eukprot:snap_masked-scaffold_5-processed-gene-13.58-mRNA-1 protein AED:1.00 eAED:1.00 QI:0/-1/0/0/-1/1/1/0/63